MVSERRQYYVWSGSHPDESVLLVAPNILDFADPPPPLETWSGLARLCHLHQDRLCPHGIR